MLNRRFIIIVVLLLLNFFLFPEGNYSVKIISFLLIAYFLFENYYDEKPKPEINNERNSSDSINEQSEQAFNISSYLEFIQKIMSFNGVSYFSYDTENDSFTLEHSNLTDGQIQERFTVLNGNPFFDEVKETNQSVLKKDIKDASFLAHYKKTELAREEAYFSPLIKNSELIGLFCYDTSEKNTFSEEIVTILTHSITLFSNTDQPNSVQASYTYEGNKLFEHFIRDCFLVKNETHFFQLVKRFVPTLFNATNFYIVKQITDSEAQIVEILGSTEGIIKYETFSLNDGIVGYALKENQFVSLDKIIQNKEFTVRFTSAEKKPERIKSFMFMPFGTDPSVGIGFESNQENAFTNDDKTRLKGLSSDLGLFYDEVLNKEEIISESIYDANGFALNFKLFKTIFLQQKTLFLRSKIPFQCIIIRILKTELKDDSYRELIYKYVFNEISNDIRPSDFIFSYNDTTFITILSDSNKAGALLVKKRYSQINGARFLVSNNYVEAEVSVDLIEKCHDKTADEIKFKLHMS